MMTRSAFRKELGRMNDRVSEMGQETMLQIEKTIQAFNSMSVPLCNEILKWDDHIDQMEQDIEQSCLDIVLKEAPVASDWRRVASYMRMISDIERIADNCCDIAEYIKRLSMMDEVVIPEYFDEMFREMREMVANTFAAFRDGDLDKASRVIDSDEIVDGLFERIREEIEQKIRETPDMVSQYLSYFMISKYIERMADHSTSIASWITYIVKGDLEMYFTDRYKKDLAQDAKDSSEDSGENK